MILLYLENPIPVFTPTPAQVERFIQLLPPHADVPVHCCRSQDEFLHLLPQATAVLVWSFQQEWFALAPHLAHICTPAAGRDYFHITPPPTVTLHYGTFHSAIMAETALAAVLANAHGLLPYASTMKADPSSTSSSSSAWPRIPLAHSAHRLALDTVAILGCGHIGSAFASLIQPFAAHTIGFHRSSPPPSANGITHLPISALEATLPSVDHLVCFLPNTPSTTLLLNAQRLALLKPTASLYNFGRGNLIDESALAAALHANHLAAAILDVFQVEPLPPSSPLRSAPNCFLYPHASAFSPDYLDLWLQRVANAIRNTPIP